MTDVTQVRDLSGRHFHLIGIGGAGMSVVAELLAARGAQVSGSDQTDSAALDHLRTCGVTTFVGHARDQLAADATVVVSSAIRPTNPEYAAALEGGQEIMHRSEALALAAEGMRFVAVAGAHGKTTTSGMLTMALRHVGADPSAAVGSVLPEIGSGALVGSGDIFVAEADESDGSFLNYAPTVELVTNIEPDHLDRYGSTEAFEQVFRDFLARLIPKGILVTCVEDAGAARLADFAVEQGCEVIRYGRPERSLHAPDVAIEELECAASSASALLRMTRPSNTAAGANSEVVEQCLHLSVPGEHNVLNAAGAWASGVWLGIEPAAMAEGLAAFHGTARRFELRGECAGRRVIDDYAHHPTEVGAALAQARSVVGEGHLTVIFQPHLYSRTISFADRFAQALSAADTVIVCDIYAAREDPVEGVDSQIITRHLSGAHFVPDMFESARLAAELTPEGGVVMTMGAGSITQVAPTVLSAWGCDATQSESADAS